MALNPNMTETEIIYSAIGRGRVAINDLMLGPYELPRACEAQVQSIEKVFREIECAIGRRDKSRGTCVSVLGISSESARALIEIGFDAALSAVVPQLAGVRLKNADYSGCANGTGMITWHPPINPFRRSSTAIEDVACTCPNDICPAHGSKLARVQAITRDRLRAQEEEPTAGKTREPAPDVTNIHVTSKITPAPERTCTCGHFTSDQLATHAVYCELRL